MTRTKCLFLYLIHIVLLQMANCIQFTKWMRWNETNVTFGTPNISFYAVSLSTCLIMCKETTECVSVHVNPANSTCELSTYYPPEGTLLATPRIGWTVYYKELIKVLGVQAWQSSLFSDCVAGNAIDGKFDEFFCGIADQPCGCRCARTSSSSSSWVMEFETSGSVKEVLPYFRVKISAYWFRNTNFSLFVHNSFEDGKTAVNGTLCTSYTQVPITSPVKLYCPKAVYGKAMRIQHHDLPIDLRLQLCEVEVFFL